MRDLARRSFRWRCALRWYLISLLAPLLIFLVAVTILYGFAPLRALAQNWLLLFTAFLLALAIMILLNNVAEEIGWAGFVFARFQDRHGSLRAALLTTVFFWLFHVPSFYVGTRSWATTALALGIFLLPHLGSRLISGWLYNGAGSSVLIAGLFHSMHNAIVNSTGLVVVLALPQFEVLVIMAGTVVLAAAIVVLATRRPTRAGAIAVRLGGAGCDPLNAIQSRQLSGQRWKLAGTRLNAEYVVIRNADDVLRIVTPRPLAVSATGEHAWIEVGTGVEDSL